jgi:hypothetical protein
MTAESALRRRPLPIQCRTAARLTSLLALVALSLSSACSTAEQDEYEFERWPLSIC